MRKIRKNIEVEINDYMSVDVSLELSEIKEFFDSCDNEEKLAIMSHLKISTPILMGKTILDTLKLELVNEAVNKYTLDELEKRLK